MRRLVCVLTCCLAAACGDNKQRPRDAAIDAIVDAGPDAWFEPPACENPRTGTNVTLRTIGRVTPTGAVLATSPKKDPRLFVVEQRGVIHIFKNEVLQPTPFIDMSQAGGGPVIGALDEGDERGLLGLAFHPNYATNRQFFVFYTGGRDGHLHDFLTRCTAREDDPDRADLASCVELLVVRDPYSNHNGGMLEFGPDGYLYLGFGDGGEGGDPQNHGQDPNILLGKMVRLDVDRKDPGKEYAIPPDNPYVGGGGLPEIYMRGLRNPWRWSFDRGTGDMWIGDVGSRIFEELDVLRPAQQRNANLGWSIYEGSACCVRTPFRCESPAPDDQCDPTGMTFPKLVRGAGTTWRAIIAGEVYRGSCFPDLVGWHFFSDWASHELVRARLKPDDTLEVVETGMKIPLPPSSIHGDARGELYVTATDGTVYRLEVAP